MQSQGYRIIPVNPQIESCLGEKSYPSLLDVPEKIDLVNIFRRPEFIPDHVKEILSMNPLSKYVSFQLGIYNDIAAKELEEHGIKVVQNRCIMVEHVNYDIAPKK